MVATICGRRSIRDGFIDERVPAAIVEDIVRSGLSAPSSKNTQPWKIHVVVDRSTMRQLADAVQHARDARSYVPIDPNTGRRRLDWPSTVRESAEVLRQVALGLFVENLGSFSTGRRAVAHAQREHRESAVLGYSLEMIGLGASIENMWLAAHSHGLGGVFMGDVLIAQDAIRERLGMSGDLVGVLALGYTSSTPLPKMLAAGRVVRHG
jgi:nitroreductase